MLYTFSNLAEHLTQLGYPEAKESGFRIIRHDLTEQEQAGNIEFKEDGTYLTIDGQKYKGYTYIKHPYIVKYGNKFPRFHITNCEVIQEQRAKGNFDNRYYWHNSNLVDLTDIQTGAKFNQVTLELCSKCKFQSSITSYSDTQGFFNLLDKQEQNINQEVEVDIFGYTLDWEQISKEYRKAKEYTCENCGIKIDNLNDRRFIHVHHKNGDKLNNRRDNLESLCVLCHANKNATHEHNFEKRRMQAEIKTFIKKYREKLEELGNKYLYK